MKQSEKKNLNNSKMNITPIKPKKPKNKTEWSRLNNQEHNQGIGKFMTFAICFTNTAVIPSLFL